MPGTVLGTFTESISLRRVPNLMDDSIQFSKLEPDVFILNFKILLGLGLVLCSQNTTAGF